METPFLCLLHSRCQAFLALTSRYHPDLDLPMTSTLVRPFNLAFRRPTGYLEPVTFPDPAGSCSANSRLLTLSMEIYPAPPGPATGHVLRVAGRQNRSSPCEHLILFELRDFAHCSSLSTCEIFLSVSLPDSPPHSFKTSSLIFNSVPRHWSTLSYSLFLQPWKVVTVTSIFILYREKL